MRARRPATTGSTRTCRSAGCSSACSSRSGRPQPFAVPEDADLPADLVGQLRAFSAVIGDVLPLGVLAAYLSGWVRLYGAVTIEVFGHLGFALDDAEPMFEAMLADMRRQLTTPRPSTRGRRG